MCIRDSQCPIKAPQALTISLPEGFQSAEKLSQSSPFSDIESNNHTLLMCQRVESNDVNVNISEINNLEVGCKKLISET